ncbi:MAG: ABC transporter ATP-binding protein [Anaerolineaceae bacterium]|nr:ABC transporter ATP-binding protein [Anaerolineaceae bacterium]
MIETLELTKIFDDFTAVNHVNLNVHSGQILALLGPNGAGKTTTVRMLSSILRPTSGWAKVAGYDVSTQPSEVRKMVGVLTEHHGLYGRMNADEYLGFFGELYGFSRSHVLHKINPLLEQLGMDQYRKKRLGEYSKGMRQKLALVRALIHEPPVLLLDEPTSAMDPESARIVRSAIKSLSNKERTIILCTHNLVEAEELCDQIAIIQEGNIILNKSMQEVKNSLEESSVFSAKFVDPIVDTLLNLPYGIQIVNRDERNINFKVEKPTEQNPVLIRFLSEKYNLLSFEEVPIKLEDAYLGAVNQIKMSNNNG